jgi:REP element-mobilizing transposase RayT
MARKPRIHYPGAVYHVILRGNAGQPVFFDDRDRFRMYIFLQRAVEKFDCRIHAFCLMTNHIHLVIQTGTTPLSRIMQQISQRYTAWINHRQSRTGHVFQGRYKALLIDADSYLLELVRYVHLNPVRAGMFRQPEEYAWSSHRAFAEHENIPWLTTEWVLSCLGESAADVLTRYEQFVLDGIGELRRAEFHSGTHEGRILGDDVFVEEALTRGDEPTVHAIALTEVIAVVCQVCEISEEQLKAPGKQRPACEARALAALLVLEAPTLYLTALGGHLGRDIATLGRSARSLAASADTVVTGRIAAARDVLAKITENQA